MHADFTPASKKEPVMKNRAYAVILAALVALLAASGASAKVAYVHANAKVAKHSLVKTSYKKIDRRMVRGL
jgi:hypothetical protein